MIDDELLANVSAFEQVKFLREEIRFEHTVLGSRISAFVTSQSFLFTAFAVSAQGQHHRYDEFVWFAYRVLPSLGFVFALFVLIAVYEAWYRIGQQREQLYANDTEAARLMNRLRPLSRNWAHVTSLLYAFVLPIACLIAWTSLFIVGATLPVK